VSKGEVIETGREIRGSVATVRLEPSPKEFLDLMLAEGIEHHIVLAYGDWSHQLTHFGRFTGIELLGHAARI
jgi:hypothetical protein